MNGLRLPRFARNDVTFKILFALSFILFSTYSNAQTLLDSSKLVSEFTVNAKFVQADELGNLYIVTPSNQLYKYNTLGKVLATLNFNYNGNISSVDATNPMEIYVFYKELNRVLFLDNNLAYRGELDLTKQNITQASAIARSYDNGIWIFDLGDLQLKKMSKEGTVTQSSGNIRQIIKTDFIPNTLLENTKQVMLANDSIALLFDVFASYIKTFKFSKTVSFQLNNDYILQTTDNQLNAVELKIGINRQVLQLENKIKWSYLSKDQVYIYKENKISIYKK
ncbi:MAG: hypothetical protein ACEQSR_15960 [Candidatus Methylacidiphilales bacterium]